MPAVGDELAASLEYVLQAGAQVSVIASGQQGDYGLEKFPGVRRLLGEGEEHGQGGLGIEQNDGFKAVSVF
jgi:hypothetical protein